MKLVLLFVFVILSTTSHSQRIALIDKNAKKPVLFTDSVSVEQIKSGYFPVEVSYMDTFYANLKYIRDEVLAFRQRSKMKSFELRAGGSYITISRVPYAYGDRYVAIAKNSLNEVQSVMPLLDDRMSNKSSRNKINSFMQYLQTNKAIFQDNPEPIQPKMYNVVVIAD